MKTDHHYPGSEGRPVTVILYGQVMTKEFVDWHTDLRQFAEDGQIDYVLRHYVGVSHLIIILLVCLR
jgi:UDP-glucose:glycoprotein glucosyltransferase